MGDVQTHGDRHARVDLHPDDLHTAWGAVIGGNWVPLMTSGSPEKVQLAAERWLHPEWKTGLQSIAQK